MPIMLLNPFTPTEIASQPDDFYGRTEELSVLERSLMKGSAIIHGPMGIGKSSLMARTLLHMEGFDSENAASSIIVVANTDIQTLDDAARCLLQELLTIDESQNKIKFGFGSLFEFESNDVVRNFREKHHLSVAMRLLRSEYLERALDSRRLLIIAIDEAEKCPGPLAQLIRALVTHTQQQGVKGVRFIVTGVSPFFSECSKKTKGSRGSSTKSSR